MFFKYHQIYRKIKKFETIVIARHIGPDPDALGSSFGLKESILKTFPKKKVYTVGLGASKFRYLGSIDKFDESMYEKSLLIVLDTPDIKRIDGVDIERFQYKIKIDHHPFIETFADLEWVDSTASSASQMIMELIFKTPLKMTKEAAKCLYVGLIADTERFLYKYTTPKTFRLVAKLIEKTGLDITEIYPQFYNRSLVEMRFYAYLMTHINVTANGFAYLKLDEETLKEQGVDAATAGNMINNFNNIEEIIAWAFFSYDSANNNIRGSIRSRGPTINEIAAMFGGGGHALASGVKLPSFEEADKLINELDKTCQKYKEEKEHH